MMVGGLNELQNGDKEYCIAKSVLEGLWGGIMAFLPKIFLYYMLTRKKELYTEIATTIEPKIHENRRGKILVTRGRIGVKAID